MYRLTKAVDEMISTYRRIITK
ncbi:Protein of unknown function [Bacillus cereus]|nr:Protein of unknown function [Bacillus cereus]